jgi:hypothetical protein
MSVYQTLLSGPTTRLVTSETSPWLKERELTQSIEAGDAVQPTSERDRTVRARGDVAAPTIEG